MSIYNKSGAAISGAYSIDGTPLDAAYNLDGQEIWHRRIKFMTYNVGGWYIGSGTNVPAEKKAEYYELQTGIIENEDPDILVIEEYLSNFSADGTSALSMLQELFPYVHTKTSGTYFGRAVCSKYPISSYTERTFTQESNRYFDSCKVSVGGHQITVIVTHLGLTQANRTPEIQQLLAYLETLDMFICGGDFNTEITPETASTSSTEYINNVKPFVDEGYNTANFGDFGFLVTYVDGDYQGYLDDIYTSGNLTITNAYVDTTKLTDGIPDKADHMPLIAEVILQ